MRFSSHLLETFVDNLLEFSRDRGEDSDLAVNGQSGKRFPVRTERQVRSPRLILREVGVEIAG